MSTNSADLSASDAARAYAGAMGEALLSDLTELQKADVLRDAQGIISNLNDINKSNVETYATMMIVCESIFRSFHDSMRDRMKSEHNPRK